MKNGEEPTEPTKRDLYQIAFLFARALSHVGAGGAAAMSPTALARDSKEYADAMLKQDKQT